ncbi:MAG: hypothetical protein ER33_05350 [Cyanobium sp. CACIAM 14]|nr:MAG: hypothetical protein ER33_05350 [Cyanobium sp. CACIAM 14]
MSLQPIPPEEKERTISAFRQQVSDDVQAGIDNHERKMTRMGFVFLAIFIGVIGLMAVLP